MEIEITSPEEQGASVKEQHTAITTRIDLLTVAAIAVVTYLTATIAHEALGHGLASLLLGLHPTRLTSVDLEVDFTGVVAWKMHFVAAAGCAANVITALLALSLLRTMRKMSAATHYYLWLLATLNLLIPGEYLLALTFTGFGDWNDFLQGMPNRLFWQIGLTLLGAIITLLGIYCGMRTMDPFLGADESQRMKRARSLILISYLAGCTVIHWQPCSIPPPPRSFWSPLRLPLSAGLPLSSFFGDWWSKHEPVQRKSLSRPRVTGCGSAWVAWHSLSTSWYLGQAYHGKHPEAQQQ